jgi:putative membrane protein
MNNHRGIAAIGATGLLLLALVPATPGSATARLTAVQADALLARVGTTAAAGTAQESTVVNDEVAIAELDPTGLPENALLISRVTAHGPARDVLDPASQTNVRYLDRLGRPEVTPDGVLLTVGGTDPTALTEARFDIPLPVAMHVEYSLDGRVIPAAEVPGASGELAVTYTLTNTDAEQAELRFRDAAGTEQTSTRPVFPPFQGTLTVTIPTGAQVLSADEAVRAATTGGETVLRWLVSLYPPISGPVQAFTARIRTDRAAVPAAEVVLAPVRSDEDPAEQFSADLLAATTEGNTTLLEGLAELDDGAASLATGSTELAGGLAVLAGGAAEVAGASDSLARGVDRIAGGAAQLAGASEELAQGVGDLMSGSDELAAGTEQLSGSLDEAASGADELARATAALAAAAGRPGDDPVAPLITGGEQVEAALEHAVARVGGPDDPVLDPGAPPAPDGDDVCPPGGTAPPDDDCVTLYQGLRLLRDALDGLSELAAATSAQADVAAELAAQLGEDIRSLGADTATAAQGSAGLLATLCDPAAPSLDRASCAVLAEVTRSSAAALATTGSSAGTLGRLTVAVEVLRRQGQAMTAASRAAATSAEELLVAVEQLGTALGQGTAQQPGLTTAMSRLNDGLRMLSTQLAESQEQLTEALAEVAGGNATLAAGLGRASDGAQVLAEGATDLAGGAAAAAAGAGELAGGAGTLATGAAGAAEGSRELAGGTDSLARGTEGAADAGASLSDGARTLQADGTAPAATAVLDSSIEPAEAQAWLEAADARAGDALPYGPPQGAVGTVAYLFTLAPVTAPLSLWERIRGFFD